MAEDYSSLTSQSHWIGALAQSEVWRIERVRGRSSADNPLAVGRLFTNTTGHGLAGVISQSEIGVDRVVGVSYVG